MADNGGSVVKRAKSNVNYIIKSNKYINKNHVFKKRPPAKVELGENVIYVSSKANIKALIERVEKLIVKNEREIYIHCMGAAIQRGILLALQISEKHLCFKVSVNTSTTELVDDLEPTTDEVDYEILRRNNSALKIKVFRTDILEKSN